MDPSPEDFRAAWTAAGLPLSNWHPGRDVLLHDAQTRPFFRARWQDGIERLGKAKWLRGRGYTVERFFREGELERILEGERDDHAPAGGNGEPAKKPTTVEDLPPEIRPAFVRWAHASGHAEPTPDDVKQILHHLTVADMPAVLDVLTRAADDMERVRAAGPGGSL